MIKTIIAIVIEVKIVHSSSESIVAAKNYKSGDTADSSSTEAQLIEFHERAHENVFRSIKIQSLSVYIGTPSLSENNSASVLIFSVQ